MNPNLENSTPQPEVVESIQDRPENLNDSITRLTVNSDELLNQALRRVNSFNQGLAQRRIEIPTAVAAQISEQVEAAEVDYNSLSSSIGVPDGSEVAPSMISMNQRPEAPIVTPESVALIDGIPHDNLSPRQIERNANALSLLDSAKVKVLESVASDDFATMTDVAKSYAVKVFQVKYNELGLQPRLTEDSLFGPQTEVALDIYTESTPARVIQPSFIAPRPEAARNNSNGQIGVNDGSQVEAQRVEI